METTERKQLNGTAVASPCAKEHAACQTGLLSKYLESGYHT